MKGHGNMSMLMNEGQQNTLERLTEIDFKVRAFRQLYENDALREASLREIEKMVTETETEVEEQYLVLLTEIEEVTDDGTEGLHMRLEVANEQASRLKTSLENAKKEKALLQLDFDDQMKAFKGIVERKDARIIELERDLASQGAGW